jgi:hypothetical protein
MEILCYVIYVLVLFYILCLNYGSTILEIKEYVINLSYFFHVSNEKSSYYPAIAYGKKNESQTNYVTKKGSFNSNVKLITLNINTCL